ncbi:MAG: acylphosphatase [Candidatus Diapherotrites archaeon]|nr:acylphosphatase [Candidatus Diapherotrites archaeon]
MTIARVLVFGNVQGVGFRAYVEQVARGMQINGFIRNLDDGTVEIYVKTQKQKINAFAKRINLQEDHSDPFSLHVTKIEVAFESDRRFIKPNRKLGRFEIDYGEEADMQKEMVKKAGIATWMMRSLVSKTDSLVSKTDSLKSETKTFRKETSHNFKRLESTLGGKTDSFRKETSNNFKRLENTLGGKTDSLRKETSCNFKRLESTLGGKTDFFRKETSDNFSKLDGKYGSISKAMGSINGNITKNNKLLSKIAGVLSRA